MVNAVDGFTQTTDVANGFSDLILSLYGSEIGMHARSAIGVQATIRSSCHYRCVGRSICCSIVKPILLVTKKGLKEAEIFCKVEPYLTFLNIHQLERQEADIQTKVEELEDLNQSLRNRDKMKDDAICQLSDQLMALTTRMQEIERKQQI